MGKKCLLLILFGIIVFGFIVTPAFSTDLKKFKGQTIRVTAWSGAYLEDFKNGYVKPFMEASGATVVVVPGWAEFIAKIKASPEDKPPWDVFNADEWNYIAAMNINRLQPIRKENIPNAKDIFPELLKREAWVKGYGVPLDGGLYVPLYNPEKINFTPTSWKDLFRPEVAGKLTFDLEFNYMLYLAALISDMAPMADEIYTKEGMDECFRISAELAKRTKKFYKSGAECLNLFETGEVVMGAYWSGGVVGWKRKGISLEMFIPEEGVPSYNGYLMVMKGAKNRDLCEAFINWCLDPQNQTNFMKPRGDWTSNKKSQIPADLVGILPSTNEEFEKITFIDYQVFLENWSELAERYKKEVLVHAK